LVSAGVRFIRSLTRELQAEGIELLPANLNEALDALGDDPVIMNALGSLYGGYYLKVKREEWNEYHDWVSQSEVHRSFYCGYGCGARETYALLKSKYELFVC
jgi:glutamine synthetase